MHRHYILCWQIFMPMLKCLCATYLLSNAGSKFQDRVFINDCDTRETILRWFKPQTAPGGFVRGGVMPQKEEMDAVCRRLVGFGLNGMAFMIRTAFTGPDLSPGEAHPTGHPFLEMIRVLALKAPCCHLVLPAIFDDVQVSGAFLSRRRDACGLVIPPTDWKDMYRSYTSF